MVRSTKMSIGFQQCWKRYNCYAISIKYFLMLLLPMLLLGQLSMAQAPANAHRWQAGDGWRYDASGNLTIITTNAQNLPLGIVRCASSAETESQLEKFKGAYKTTVQGGFSIEPLPYAGKLPCFSQKTESRGVAVAAPSPGEEIVWFNFDIRPLAGTYQFQIVTNENVGWALFHVDPSLAGPPATGSGTYPPTATGLSGDYGNLVYADCGVSGNGWSTITVPSFTKPSNYYLAMWMAEPGVTTFSNSMNLVYKSRFGCGGSTCALEKSGNDVLTCNTNGTYTVCATYFGSAGKWAISAPGASSYTVTTYNQANQVVTTESNPQFVELGTTSGSFPQNDIKAVICATYPLGTNYAVTLTPNGPPSDAPNNYIACTTSGSFSGTGLTAISATETHINVACNGGATGSIDLTPSGGTAPYSYTWTASNGGAIPAGQANSQDLTGLVAGTYSVVVSDASGATTVCTATKQVVITEPNALSCVAVQTRAVSCNGGADGEAVVTPSGGTAPYTFSLGGQTNNTGVFGGLAAGPYTSTVTDANGCQTTCQVIIGEPDILIATPFSIDASCAGNDGSASVTISGGSGSYSVVWTKVGAPSFNMVGPSISGLSAGTYTFVVEDANGCRATANLTLGAATCGHIFPTGTTCCQYATGQTNQLFYACYKVNAASKTVTNMIPGVFFYYADAIAPATLGANNSFYIEVRQTRDLQNFKLFLSQNDANVRLTDGVCEKVNYTIAYPENGVIRYFVTGATPGRKYIISVKYDVKSTLGSTYASDDPPDVQYTFRAYVATTIADLVTALVEPNSEGILTARFGCSDNTVPVEGDCITPTVTTRAQMNVPTFDEQVSSLTATAYPNPYNDKVRFTLQSPLSGQGSLEVFNMLGQRMATVYQGFIEAGKTKVVEFNVPDANRTSLIYSFKVGNQRVSGKVLH